MIAHLRGHPAPIDHIGRRSFERGDCGAIYYASQLQQHRFRPRRLNAALPMPTLDQWRDAIRAAKDGRPRELVHLWESEGRLPAGTDEAVRALLWGLQAKPTPRGEVLLDALIELRDRVSHGEHWRAAHQALLSNPRYGLKDSPMIDNLPCRPDVRSAMKARGIKFKIPKVTSGET